MNDTSKTKAQLIDELSAVRQSAAQQGRALQVETCLERVRRLALDMQGFDDLVPVSAAIFASLAELGFDLLRSAINVKGSSWIASADRDGGIGFFAPDPNAVLAPRVAYELELQRQASSRGEALQERFQEIEQARPGVWAKPEHDREVHYRLFMTDGTLTLVAPQELAAEEIDIALRFAGPFEFAFWSASVPFAHGAVGMFKTDSDGAFADDHIHLLERFTGVVALAYTRFLDFQRLEEQNAQIQQASLNKSQFLRRMSHDLRSPMNAIIGYTRLLRRRLADRVDEREARNLANIETSSGNLLNLINDILDLSRIEAGRIVVNTQDFDPRALANECADSLASIVTESVVLRRNMDDVGLIHSDPDRLRQVVMNLHGNAIKFTETGTITLSLKRIDGSSDANGDGAVEFAIADTGIGIPEDDLPHIFDEFRQVERQVGEGAEGTGLGLAIAKKTVDLLGGQIDATSKVGVGTTFTVRLGAS